MSTTIWTAGNGGAGGPATDATARSATVANATQIAAIGVAQTAQDNLIAAAATDVEVAAIKVLVDANTAANANKEVVSVTRVALDQSLLITYDDSTTDSVAAAPAGSIAVDNALSNTSANPVENKVVKASIDALSASVGVNTASINTINTTLAGKADQTALQAVIDMNATQAELDTVEAKIPTGVTLTNAVRAGDGGIDLTFSDASTGKVAAVVVHPAVKLKAGSNAALTLDEATQELNLDLPAAETKDAVPTDLSVNAVESQGIKAANDAQDLVINSKADQSALATEINRATVAEGVNATAIATETTRATNAETAIQTALTQEITDRTTADSDHIANRAYHAPAATIADEGKIASVDAAGQVIWNSPAVIEPNDITFENGVPQATDIVHKVWVDVSTAEWDTYHRNDPANDAWPAEPTGKTFKDRVGQHFHTNTNFDFNAFVTSSGLPSGAIVRIANTSSNSGIGITYKGTLSKMDVGRLSSASATVDGSFNLSPLQYVDLSHDGTNTIATVSDGRDKGYRADIAALKAVAQNSLATGDFADVGTTRYVYDSTVAVTVDNEKQVIPDDQVGGTGAWQTLGDGVIPSANYVNGEPIVEDNATATDANIRLLEVPTNYIGSDMTAGEKWLVQPGTAATFPFTMPTIANGANLLTAVGNDLLKPLSPEVTANKSYTFNSTTGFNLSVLDLQIGERIFYEAQDGDTHNLRLLPDLSNGKIVKVDGVTVTPVGGLVEVLGIKKAIVYQGFKSGAVTSGITYINTFKDAELEAPKVADLWTLNADSNNTPIEQDTALHQTGRPIKSVLFTATANAERHTWDVNGKDLVLSISPVNTVPFTIQGIGATAATTSSWDIAVDGTVTDNATDTNEFSMTVTTEDRGIERVIKISSTSDLTQLKVWGNAIGAPAGLFNNSYVLDVPQAVVPITQRKEQTYFAHSIPDNANGVYEVNGQTVTDQDLANWITANPITGFSVSGSQVTLPDWRGRYLGASNGRGISSTAGQLLASVNKSHTHRVYTGSSAAVFGNQSPIAMVDAHNNWQNSRSSSSANPLVSEGSTYARPETVGMPICIFVGATQEYVKKDDLLEVEDSEVVLINADASNNVLYPFSTGETWADIKANYTHLRITGNVSVSGSNNVKPYSFNFDPNVHTLPSGMSGARIDIDDSHNGVTSYLNFPSDTDTGLTYRQSGGDAPTSGRMQFKVVGVKKQKTVTNPDSITITNPNDSDTSKVLMPNGDGTATFQDAPSGVLETSLATHYKIEGRKINGKQLWRVDFETAAPAANSVVAVAGLIPVGWDVIRGYSLQVLKSNTFRGFEWYGTNLGFRWDISQGTGNLNLRQVGNLIGSGGVVTGYFEYTRTDGQ